MAKRNYGHELWEKLLGIVQEDDGLPKFCASGLWTAKKLYFVCQYLEQTTRGMKNRRGFSSGLTYIDLFCGTGVAEYRATDGRVRRFPGSPLIAACTPNPFDRLILVDINQENLDALAARLLSTNYQGQVILKCGDSNEITEDIVSLVPTDSLNVAFIDPYSLDVKYETIRKLAANRALDLIILFSDRLDLGRNVFAYYRPDNCSKLDVFLGDSSWRERLDALGDQTGTRVRTLFADIYLEQLEKLGYTYAQSWPLEGPQGPVFRLIFASKNELGLKYCNIALSQDFEGNRGLFGA